MTVLSPEEMMNYGMQTRHLVKMIIAKLFAVFSFIQAIRYWNDNLMFTMYVGLFLSCFILNEIGDLSLKGYLEYKRGGGKNGRRKESKGNDRKLDGNNFPYSEEWKRVCESKDKRTDL